MRFFGLNGAFCRSVVLSYGRICNPTELSISIFNALIRIKTGRSVVRSDLDKLLAFCSVQMNLHCTHLIAVLQSDRIEYKHFQCAFFGLNGSFGRSLFFSRLRREIEQICSNLSNLFLFVWFGEQWLLLLPFGQNWFVWFGMICEISAPKGHSISLVAYGEKSFKSVQIFQIFLYWSFPPPHKNEH